jgi:cysteine synthase A
MFNGNIRGVHSEILNIYRSRLVTLDDNLTAAVFPFMKIFPADFCLRRAREQESINPQSIIVETSSGNMALGLAIVCKLYGYRLTIVSDYACDGFLRRRIEDLGARVEIVPAPAAVGGYQQARLDRLQEIRAECDQHWWLNQYANPANPGSYGSFAAQLVEAVGHIDCLVGAVGSGGSLCGTASFLRELFPEMTTVAVDTFGSVLFGQPEEPRTIRGMGNSILPENLDHSAIDEVHWVSAAEAYKATRTLHQQTSLFCGGTSGAAWLVARYWATQNPRARVVCIFPDDGYRYTETIYNDQYLWNQGLWLEKLPASPNYVEHPLDADGEWSCMRWGRRAYAEVVRPAAQVAAVR